MARTPLRSIRITDDEWTTWETTARARGMSVTELIRGAVATSIVAPAVARALKDTAARQSIVPPATSVPPKKRTGACERERHHRKGSFCKACGTTP